MGVPKFYRWLSERYPCLSEIVKENQIPEFDNLYLDMNGIIHACSHPNDEDPHFRITEEQIFRDIFRYIEVLYRIIRPRKVFFMAVDGVAPRAKMNQQRGRRFMSARTAQELIERAKSKGEKLPTEERFDSNCITPGTHFMAKLHEQLKYFVNMKITTDDMWQGIRIYLSGHDVPGEGEHKIMDFIRHERSQPDYDPNTRHCLYGLDADLIMLGVCSHEPYFCLLREEVKFVRPSKKLNVRTANAEQTTFHLLHLSLLRDYIELEFSTVKHQLQFDFDLESIIDDWVLMGFLVGNDFIPHLPNLHIHSNALPTLYKAYMKTLPELGGYINEGGFLNLPRFEKFMAILAQFDRDSFRDEYEDLMWLESKSSGGPKFGSRDVRESVPRKIVLVEEEPKPLVPYVDSENEGLGTGSNSNSDKSSSPRAEALAESTLEGTSGEDLDCADYEEDEDISHLPPELQDLIRRSDANIKNSESSADDDMTEEDAKMSKGLVNYELCGYDEDDDSWSPDMEKAFRRFKSNYYMDKMSYNDVTAEVLRDQAVQYVRAIQWNLHYYYNGVCSWSWYYPHHYAPYLSDVKNFSDLEIHFELGEPFVPFQQLLAVLPAASRKLLPSGYQALMTNADSPLIDFYPSHFETDLNGKKNDWEAVILIPFIKEDRLLEAMRPLDAMLAKEEKARNKPGKHLLYTTAIQDQGYYRSSLVGVFPDLDHNKAMCKELDRNAFRLQPSQIRKGRLPGIRSESYVLGFSTLKHLPYTGEVKFMGVQVFQQVSKNESVLVKLLEDPRCSQTLAETADRLVGKEVFVNYPHLIVGLVTGVSNESERYMKDNSKDVNHVSLNEKDAKAWNDVAEESKTTYLTRRAVAVGDVNMMVHAQRLIGRRYVCDQKGEMKLEKQWGDIVATHPLQTIVEDLTVADTTISENFTRVDELFTVGSKVFLISNPFYGCEGVVTEGFDPQKCRLKVQVTVKPEPDFSRLIANQKRIGLFWYPGWQAAKRLDISGHVLSRITGTVYVTEKSAAEEDDKSGKRCNIGLNLKFSRKNEEVPDYTKRDEDGMWWYSSKVLQILDEYYTKFPEILNLLHGRSGNSDVYSAEEFWKLEESQSKLKELLDWLKLLPSHGLQPQATGTECVDERVIRAIESAVDKTNALNNTQQKHLGVRPNALFRSCMVQGTAAPDSRADYQLFDRVVCAREGYTVPLGLRGTVVGIHRGRQEGDLKLSVIFDKEFVGGMNIRNSRTSGYHISASALINLNYGVRLKLEKENAKRNTSVAVHQQIWNQQAPGYFDMSQRHPVQPQQPTQDRQVSRDIKMETRRTGHGAAAAQMDRSNAQHGQVKILSKGHNSSFDQTQKVQSITKDSGKQPKLQKSKSESQHTPSSGASQVGRSIMHELFPQQQAAAASASMTAEMVFVNSTQKKGMKGSAVGYKLSSMKLPAVDTDREEEEEEQDDDTMFTPIKKGGTSVEESTRALRTLLNMSGPKEKDSKKRSDTCGKSGKAHHNEDISSSPPDGPRVPFTARQPQPPPFEPSFPPDLSPVLPQPPPQLENPPQPQGIQPPVMMPFHMFSPPVPMFAAGAPGVQLRGQQQQAQGQQMAPMQQPYRAALPGPPAPLPPQFYQYQQMRQHQQHFHQLQEAYFRQQQHQHQQQQHQQHSRQWQQHQQSNAQNQGNRQRQNSNSGGGFEQFVPMQVTKKQPAPAYVKGIAGKDATEQENTGSAAKAQEMEGHSFPNARTGSNSGGARSKQAFSGGSSGHKHPIPASSSAVKPKPNKSRLAIKFAPQH